MLRPDTKESPSFRIRIGSVSPCKTKVTKITEKVRKMMRFRCGKGEPSCNAVGREMAAARANTPRIPVQATTKTCFGGGGGMSSCIQWRRNQYAIAAPGKTQMILKATTSTANLAP